MESNFHKSWSIHGYNRLSHGRPSVQPEIEPQGPSDFDRNRPMFHSGRSRANLQQRFGLSEQRQNRVLLPTPERTRPIYDENEHPFYLKPQTGLRFRSLTDSNIRQFEVNGVTKSCNEVDSPRSSFSQPFRQLPQRIGPILNNIQNTVNKAGPKTEKLFKKGGEKVQRAFQGVRTSFNSLSQRFKRPTRRRYKLDNTPTRTPGRTPSRVPRVTPGKLYSPFDVNTPRTPHSYMRGPKRLQSGPVRRDMFGCHENLGLCRTPQRVSHSSSRMNWTSFNSPQPHLQDGRNHFRLDSVFPPLPERPYPHYVNVPPRI